jgi:hypothetical protein
MSEPDVSPSDAVAESDLTSPTDPDDEVADDETSIVDMLLSTEPADSPANYPGRPAWMSHMIIGVKKSINAAADTGIGAGTTALENFALGGIGLYLGEGGDANDQNQGGEQRPRDLDEQEDTV